MCQVTMTTSQHASAVIAHPLCICTTTSHQDPLLWICCVPQRSVLRIGTCPTNLWIQRPNSIGIIDLCISLYTLAIIHMQVCFCGVLTQSQIHWHIYFWISKLSSPRNSLKWCYNSVYQVVIALRCCRDNRKTGLGRLLLNLRSSHWLLMSKKGNHMMGNYHI